MISYRLSANLLPALPSSIIRLLLLLALMMPVATVQAHEFDVTVLGAAGGLEDGNLSAYLVREAGTSSGVLLDAGTVLNGIEKADAAHAFDGLDLGADRHLPQPGLRHRDAPRLEVVAGEEEGQGGLHRSDGRR